MSIPTKQRQLLALLLPFVMVVVFPYWLLITYWTLAKNG